MVHVTKERNIARQAQYTCKYEYKCQSSTLYKQNRYGLTFVSSSSSPAIVLDKGCRPAIILLKQDKNYCSALAEVCILMSLYIYCYKVVAHLLCPTLYHHPPPPPSLQASGGLGTIRKKVFI